MLADLYIRLLVHKYISVLVYECTMLVISTYYCGYRLYYCGHSSYYCSYCSYSHSCCSSYSCLFVHILLITIIASAIFYHTCLYYVSYSHFVYEYYYVIVLDMTVLYIKLHYSINELCHTIFYPCLFYYNPFCSILVYSILFHSS